MAWIESHQELGAHPKTRKLALLLGVSRPTAVGHLQFLWWWATSYAEDGDLSRFEPMDVAIGAEWEGDPVVFVDALVAAGFLDRDDAGVRVHDWQTYAGKLIQRRKANAERVREARAKADGEGEQPRASHVPRTQRARAERPNTTIQNTTGEDRENAPPPPVEPEPEGEGDPSGARTDGDVYALVDAFAEGKGLARSDVVGKYRQVAYRTFAQAPPGVGPTEVMGCTSYLMTDPFWQPPGKLKPQTVVDTLPEWLRKGRPASERVAARASPNGRREAPTEAFSRIQANLEGRGL